jgi:hypothetical protein
MVFGVGRGAGGGGLSFVRLCAPLWFLIFDCCNWGG